MSDERITLMLSIPKALADLLIDSALVQKGEESHILNLDGVEPTGALLAAVASEFDPESTRGVSYSLGLTEEVRQAAFEHVVKAYIERITPRPPCTHTNDDGRSTINAMDICDACGLDLETGLYDGEEPK